MRNMNDLVRQAGVMQNKIAKMPQEMAERTVEASGGGGMVKVVAPCPSPSIPKPSKAAMWKCFRISS